MRKTNMIGIRKYGYERWWEKDNGYEKVVEKWWVESAMGMREIEEMGMKVNERERACEGGDEREKVMSGHGQVLWEEWRWIRWEKGLHESHARGLVIFEYRFEEFDGCARCRHGA